MPGSGWRLRLDMQFLQAEFGFVGGITTIVEVVLEGDGDEASADGNEKD